MEQQLTWLGPPGSPSRFPSPDTALTDPNGLLAAGGDLSPGRLLDAYRQGIFPWYETGQPILWWSPDPRTVIFPHKLHIARRFRRELANRPFEASFDNEFAAVIHHCARRGARSAGSWITPAMSAAYEHLHSLGHAHSVETYRDGDLVGGLYGVSLGRVFFAESMFSRVSNGSKAALVYLAATLQRQGFAMIDCQLPSPHLARLGARNLNRGDFILLLREHVDAPPATPILWPRQRQRVDPPDRSD